VGGGFGLLRGQCGCDRKKTWIGQIGFQFLSHEGKKRGEVGPRREFMKKEGSSVPLRGKETETHHSWNKIRKTNRGGGGKKGCK